MFTNLFSQKAKKEVDWVFLNDISMLDEIDQQSFSKPVLIFKHSTRCSISSMTLNRFENSVKDEAGFQLYFLDLISHRDISNEVAMRYQVEHQSPQAILVRDGKAVYDASHTGIIYEEVERKVTGLL